MARKHNYLSQIATARNLDKLAMLIRAQGLYITSSSAHLDTPEALHTMAIQYERDAHTVERCIDVSEARKYLRDRGYIH